MNNYIRKYPATTFYITTFLLSGIMILLNIFVFPGTQKFALTLPQLAPAIIAIIFILLTKGQDGLNKLFKHFYVSRENYKWIILSILVPIVAVSASYIVYSIVYDGSVKLPVVDKLSVYLYYLVGIIIGSIGEEVGWRGFMLPHLQSKYKPLVSSLILGFFWGVWHINVEFGLLGYLLNVIIVMELSILFTWLYNKTKGNLFIAVVFHTVINIMTRVLLLSRLGVSMFIIEIAVFGICCILVLYFSFNFIKPFVFW